MIRHNPQPAIDRSTSAIRVIVAADDLDDGELIRGALMRGPDLIAPVVSPLELIVDRATHSNPSLAIVVLPQDPDRAYAYMRQLSETLPVKILAAGPADDPQLILRTLHEGGADEYLDLSRLDEELGGALQRFRAKSTSTRPTETGSAITIIGPSGGCGASLIAVNLATVLARKTGACGLVDLRLCNGDLASLMDLEPQYGLAELCANLGRLDRSMLQQFFTDHASGVRLLSAPQTLQGIETVTPAGVRQALAMARSEFRYVVVDLDNVVADEQQEAIWQSELMLLIVRPDYTSLRNVRRTLEHLRYLGIDSSKIRVIANRIGERGQLSMAQLEEGLGQTVSAKLSDEPSRVNVAVNAGVPIVSQRPRARVSRQLVALAETLTRAVHPAGLNGS